MNDHKFIQRIYDSALNADSLPDVLQELADRSGAFGAILFDCHVEGNHRKVGLEVASSVFQPGIVEGYLDEYNQYEIADQDRMAALSTVGDDVSLVQAASLYGPDYPPGPNVEALLSLRVRERFGALLSKESWNVDRFALQYAVGQPAPTPEVLQSVQSVLSHLAKSLNIGRAFQDAKTANAALMHYLDGIGIGVAIVDARGRLCYLNLEMSRILQDSALMSRSPEGRLRFAQSPDTPAIDALLYSENAHGKHGARPRKEAVFLTDPHAEPGAAEHGLFIEICPIKQHPDLDNFGDGARMVTVLDSRVIRDIDTSVLTRYFPLSASEIAVAGLMSKGLSNVEIAEIRGRSVETVNSQVKAVLRKTESRNRTELVKVGMGLSALVSKMEPGKTRS